VGTVVVVVLDGFGFFLAGAVVVVVAGAVVVVAGTVVVVAGTVVVVAGTVVVVAEVVVVVAEVAHTGPVMVLSSSVTVAAVSAKTRPFKVAPVSKAVVSATLLAIIVPIKAVVVPSVAALPTLHHTLQGSPPVTDEPGDVMRVDTVLKIHTPEPVRVRFPLSEKLLVEQ